MSKPLPVLYVTSNGYCMGGVETSLETLIRFHSKAIEPHVAFLTPGFVVDRMRNLRPGITVVDCRAGRLRDPIKGAKTVLLLRRHILAHGIKVVVANGVHPFAYASLAGKSAGARTVLHPHAAIGGHELSGRWVKGSSRLPADLVVATSRRNRDRLDDFFKGRRNIKIIYYGIDLEPFRRADEARVSARRELGIPLEAPVVLLSGRVTPWKGQHVLIKAAPEVLRRFPQARFLFVGGTTFKEDFPYEESLHQLGRDLGITSSLLFTGFRTDVPRFYAAADIVVNTSVQAEGFGIVMIEGSAAGKPVLASRIGAPEEIVRDGETGFLFPVGDHAALADRVVQLLSDSHLRRTLGERGKKEAFSRFSAERMAREFENAYDELV
ncbi:MAG: glycosyltransferase family 4 protein [Nitrospirae bacterium]|nr:glycosyltransferase family 4 protein [Nitrospirota bacterium]